MSRCLSNSTAIGKVKTSGESRGFDNSRDLAVRRSFKTYFVYFIQAVPYIFIFSFTEKHVYQVDAMHYPLPIMCTYIFPCCCFTMIVLLVCYLLLDNNSCYCNLWSQRCGVLRWMCLKSMIHVMGFHTIPQHRSGRGRWNNSQQKTKVCLSCLVIHMTADDLATHGTRQYKAVVLPV